MHGAKLNPRVSYYEENAADVGTVFLLEKENRMPED